MAQKTSATFTRKRNSHGLLRPTLIAILLSSTMVSAPFLTQAVAESFAFSSVVVKGNESVDAATILAYAGIAKGASVSPGELNDAYQRIFASGLFASVDLTPQGSTLVITVVELPLLNVVDFQGNKLIKDEKLVELVKSKSRLVYSPAPTACKAVLPPL
jgi:outer membrane protein insertion porin family